MAASIFRAITNLRMVLDTETDADSPHNETTYAALREMAEMLFKLAFSTGETGTVTTIAETILTDSARAWTIDEHIGRTLLMTSGAAKGNFYTIDDNAATTLTLTGDTLVSDGVVITDDYEILFDIKTNSDGHDHDAVNSKKISASIDVGALDTGTSSVSQAGATGQQILTGGLYSFYPQTKNDATMQIMLCSGSYANYVTNVGINAGAGETGYAQNRYITASGPLHWVFILRRKDTKKIISMSQAPDHVCFGNGGDPEKIPHPFNDIYEENGVYKYPIRYGNDPVVKEIAEVEIIVMNPNKDMVLEIKKKAYVENKDFTEIMLAEYDIDEIDPPSWPIIPVSVGLPPEWDDAWRNGKSVKSIKKIIPRPNLVKTAALKKKLTEVTK